MIQRVISSGSSKNYHLKPCPHCGGRLYFDKEDREWRCLNCARRPKRPISTTDNSISTANNLLTTSDKGISANRNSKNATETPLMSAESPAISKGRRAFVSVQRPENKTPERVKIYEAHSINGPWWPPDKITFHHRQILFLIKNLPQLREGCWPANPAGSGYIDLPMVKKGKTRSHKSYFEIPTGIATEVEARLEKCGIDGLLLEAIECWGKSEQSLAKHLGMPVWSIRKRANNALRYVSGLNRKNQSYKEFISHRKVKGGN